LQIERASNEISAMERGDAFIYLSEVLMPLLVARGTTLQASSAAGAAASGSAVSAGASASSSAETDSPGAALVDSVSSLRLSDTTIS
jgi:hypothetical protein